MFKQQTLLAAVLLAVAAAGAHAQATRRTAERKADLQIGGSFLVASPDYSPNRFIGLGGYITYDFKPRWGVELNIRQANTRQGDHVYERTYQIGGRYVYRVGPLNPYARASIGRGVFNFPYTDPNPPSANLAYNMYSLAGGLDYNFIPAINLRAEYEYQRWGSFPPRGLSPQVFSMGAAYHFH